VRALAVGFGALVAVISAAASLGFGVRYLVLIHSLPGGDIVGHFLLIGSLAFVSALAFVEVGSPRRWFQWARVVVVLGTVMAGDELLQIALPLRSFSLHDLLANAAGILVFSLLAVAWRARWRLSPKAGG
jgi:VanZ family protein